MQHFVYERSSGYDGFRCHNCGVWLYADEVRKGLPCNCPKNEPKYNKSMKCKVKPHSAQVINYHDIQDDGWYEPANETSMSMQLLFLAGKPVIIVDNDKVRAVSTTHVWDTWQFRKLDIVVEI